MGPLFVNKILGSILATFLVVFGLNELAHFVYHPHVPHEPAYHIALPENGGATDVVVVEGPTDYGLLLREANIAAGERTTAQCRSCHTFEQDGGALQGPNLWNVVNRVAGSVPGFGYSPAMTAYGRAWTFESLDRYLESPRTEVPSTAMTYNGLRRESQRIDLIAYLRTLSNSPAEFPDPLPAEAPEEEPPAEDAIAEETEDDEVEH